MSEEADGPIPYEKPTPPERGFSLPTNLKVGRMSEPMVTVNPDPKTVEPINQSGLGQAAVPQWLVIGLTVVVALAGVLISLPAMGIALPGVVISIAGVILSIGAAFGIASPGVRKPQ